MEHANTSHILSLPTELLTRIVSYCDDLPTANNLLQSCKDIHRKYATFSGTIAERSFKKIFFGIDRVIVDNPELCKSLSNAAHMKGLIHYAQKYYYYPLPKNKTIFYVLLKKTQQMSKMNSIKKFVRLLIIILFLFYHTQYQILYLFIKESFLL